MGKALSLKYFGVDSVKELLAYIRDTVSVAGKNDVLETHLPDDLASNGIFVMLTEEARRSRHIRIDMGDESAKLKIQGTVGTTSAAAKAAAQLPKAGGLTPA